MVERTLQHTPIAITNASIALCYINHHNNNPTMQHQNLFASIVGYATIEEMVCEMNSPSKALLNVIYYL